MKNFQILGIVVLLLSSCGEKTLEQLKTEKLALVGQIEQLDSLIASLDTVKQEAYYAIVDSALLVPTFFEHRVSMEGGVEMEENALVQPEAQGLVRDVSVKFGDFVRKGDKICRIDNLILSKQLKELEERKGLAEYVLNKQKSLNEKGVGTEFDLERAQSDFNAIEANIAAVNAQLSKFTVKAPFSGWVEDVFVKEGEMAAPGGPIIRLVNLKDARVTLSISERYISRIKIGDEMKFTVPVLGDTLMSAKITSIGKFVNPVNRTITVKADVKNNKVLLPNMVVKAKIKEMEHDSVFMVSKEAIVQNARQQEFVYVLKDFDEKSSSYKVSKILIERMGGDGDKAAIQSPELHKGGFVVTNGALGINENSLVKIRQ